MEKITSMLKTQPFAHQIRAFEKAQLTNVFANFSDQGTGKTWSSIAEIFALAQLGKIDRVLILAPKGVDANWTNIELPVHAPDEAAIVALWRPKETKKWKEEMTNFFASKQVKILAMNWDAIAFKRGYEVAEWFLSCGSGMIIADESQRIKNPKAKRTKAALKLAAKAKFKRILTGTPATRAPFDLWSQFAFLDERILNIPSYRAFCCRHAVMASGSDYEMIAIKQKIKQKIKRQYLNANQEMIERLVNKRTPLIVKRDVNGAPMYLKLEEIQQKIEQHSFRVTKEECLDLPSKIYTQMFFELTTQQQKIYNELKYKLRLILDDDTIQPLIKLTALQKMSQVCSGYFITQEGSTEKIEGANPKLQLLEEKLNGTPTIIWSIMRQESNDIVTVCKKLQLNYVEYHGEINDKDKAEAIKKFQDGTAQIFIGRQQSAGLGLTLTAAQEVIYYSNSFNLEHRLQSEDRAHRIGQTTKVLYTDLIAEHTVECEMIRALQRKDDMARILVGDQLRQWLV